MLIKSVPNVVSIVRRRVVVCSINVLPVKQCAISGTDSIGVRAIMVRHDLISQCQWSVQSFSRKNYLAQLTGLVAA